MDEPHWLRTKELLADLADCPVGERASRLDTVCGGDTALRAELERLLALDDEAGRFFTGLELSLRPVDVAPVRVGVYRIDKEIGRGGMATVYLGRRDDGQFDQTVAIKVMRLGVGTDMHARFRAERRILAQLSHPGIAYLMDGGRLDDGRPYFIMEHVPGEPLTAYADRKRLDLAARLRLFADICAAVAHAHRNLVIHRDLKPGNVLVHEDDQGRATIKLLDFGIARVIEEGLHEGPQSIPAPGPMAGADGEATEYGRRILTPRYAAPEQLRGEAVTAAADVHALGVLLQVLLTGAHPFAPADASRADMERRVLAGQAMAPSVAAARQRTEAAALRGHSPRTLARALRGDLDAIVAKALVPDPSARYEAAGALARDLHRHRQGRTVSARTASVGYRTGTFVRRHRLAVAAGVSIVLAATVFGMWHIRGIMHARDRARTAAAEATQISSLLVGIMQSASPDHQRGKGLTVQEVLDRASREIDGRLARQPEVLASMHDIMGAIYAQLGAYEKAQNLLQRALRERRALYGPDQPKVLDTLQNQAVLAWMRFADADAETLLRHVLATRLQQRGPDDLKVASAQNDLAAVLRRQGNRVEAEILYRAALATRVHQLPKGHEDIVSTRNNLAVLLSETGRRSEAEALYRQVLASRRATLGPAHPKLANSISNLGLLLRREGRLDEAEQLLREAVQVQQQVYHGPHVMVAHAMNLLAGVLRRQGKPDDAERWYRKALEMRRDLLGADNPAVASSLNNLANLYRDRHQYTKAVSLYRQAIDIYRDKLGNDHPWTATSIKNLGVAYLESGAAVAAEKRLREALRIRKLHDSGAHWKVAEVQSLLGAALASQGKREAAEALLRAGYDTLKNARGADDHYTVDAKARLLALGGVPD